MRVLVTGSSGLVGGQVVRDLLAAGHEPVLFDIADGQSILDRASLEAACAGCDEVVHSAAMLGKPWDDMDQVFQVNVVGTWNVLCAARTHGVSRFVYISSVNTLGVFQGQSLPDYLPIDDAHPRRPFDAYGVSKHLGEEMCADICRLTGMVAVALRPPWVLASDQYGETVARQKAHPEAVYDKWEYGSFIDVRDLSAAVLAGLVCEIDGFESMLVCGPDVMTVGPSSCDMVREVLPEIAWRGGVEFDDDPFRSLVNCDKAARILGIEPQYRWADGVADLKRP